MTLPAPNVWIDIYRGFSAKNPYPNAAAKAVASGVPAYLQHHHKCGRFGFGMGPLNWTHKLLVDIRDIRDAYAGQPAPNLPATTDTIIIPWYPDPYTCTAFEILLIQTARTPAADYLIAYLDRMLPLQENPLAPTCYPDTTSVCCANAFPMQLKATLTDVGGQCPCMTGYTFQLYYQYAGADQGKWTGSGTFPCAGATALNVKFSCPPTGKSPLDLILENQGCTQSFWNTAHAALAPVPTCDPLSVYFAVGSNPQSTCCGNVALVSFLLQVTP